MQSGKLHRGNRIFQQDGGAVSEQDSLWQEHCQRELPLYSIGKPASTQAANPPNRAYTSSGSVPWLITYSATRALRSSAGQVQ